MLSLFLLPVDLDVESPAPSPAPDLLMCCLASCHDDNGLNLETVNHPQLNAFLCKNAMVSESLHSGRTLTKTLWLRDLGL